MTPATFWTDLFYSLVRFYVGLVNGVIIPIIEECQNNIFFLLSITFFILSIIISLFKEIT